MKKLLLLCFLLPINFTISHAQVIIDTIGAGSALKLDTKDVQNYVDFGGSYNSLNFPFTLEMWIYPTSNPTTGYTYIFSTNDPLGLTYPYSGTYFYISPQLNIGVYFGDDKGNGSGNRRGLITSSTVSLNTWTHIAIVVMSMSDIYIYFNGVLQTVGNDGGGSNITTLTHSPGPTTITFAGQIDEVRLWDDSLSQTTIRQNMCRKINGDTTGLVGYWRFDEADTSRTVYDYSSNGINGKFIDSVYRVISDAPFGNRSSYLYTSNWSGAALKLGSVTGDTLIASQVSGVPNGVQIYSVNSLPYYTEGLQNTTHNYFGVFCTNGPSSSSYTLTCHYSLADGLITSTNQGSAALEKRIDATDTPWTPLNGVLNTSNQTISKINQVTPQEYILSDPCDLSLSAKPQSSTICSGQSVTLTATGAPNYLWSPSTGLSSNSNAIVTANPTISTTYTVYGSTTSGCKDSATVVIKVNPPPVVAVTPPDSIICRGYTVTLTASGASAYQWNPSTGLSSTTNSIVIANPTSTTTYRVNGTDSSGCSDSAEVAITVMQNSVQILTHNTSVCQGNSVALIAIGGSHYSWSPSTGLNKSTGSIVTATPDTTTNYILVATGNGGCSDTQNVVIGIYPPPSLSISPSQPAICFGQSTTLTANGAPTYLWNPSTGLSSNTLSTVIANPTITTTYTLYGTSSVGCNDSTKVVLTVNPLPVINIAPSDSAICRGYSATLTASGASTYEWSPSTGLNSTTNSTVIANPTINTTYNIIGTSLSGCIDSTTVAIRVVQDSLQLSTNSTSVCQGNSAILTATGAYSYIWSPSTGLNQTTGDTVTATPFSTTSYTLIATGAIGCLDTQKVVVNVNLPPVLTIAPLIPQICIGQSTALKVKGASTYSWSPSTGLSQTTGSAVTANPTTTTTYTAYGTDSLGCNDSSKVVLVVNPLPVINIAPPDPAICRGYSATLTASGASTYEWSPSTGLNTTTNSTVIANPTINTTYNIIGTSLSGCIDSTTVAIRVVQDSLQVSTNSTSVCQGNSAILTATGAYSYNWSPSTGLNQTTGDTVTATPFSTTSYTLIATGAIGCLDTQKVVVNVNLPPVLAITPPLPVICIGHPTPLTVSGALTYSWSPSTGLNQTNGSALSANPTATTTYTTYGTDVNGCNDSTKVVVKVNPLPIVTVAPLDSLVCNGLSVPLTATGASSYQWNPSTGLNSTTDSAVVAAPTITTTYTVYGTDTAGCTDTVTATVRIIPNSIVITVKPANSIICLGDSASLTASGGTHYSWSPSAAINTTTGDIITVNPFSTTTYTVIGTGLGDCADTTNAIIVVSPPPTISVQPQEPEICYGQAIPLTASGASIYEWSPSTGLYETSGSTVDAHSTVTTTYTIYGTDSLGCNDSTKFTLEVKSAPVGAFTTSVPSICDPLQIQFSNTTTDGVSYLWSFSDGDSSTEQNPVHTFPKTGIYSITLISTSENGCTDTITAADTLSNTNANVFAPNSFTPSIPGVNQVFNPNIICTAPSNYTFKIYDRWGVLIYETADPTQGWDGTFKGKAQPLGAYVYYLQVTCGTCIFFKKGDVTLLR